MVEKLRSSKVQKDGIVSKTQIILAVTNVWESKFIYFHRRKLKLFGVNYCLYPNNFQTFQTFESFVEKSSSTFFVGKFEFRTPEKVIDANISEFFILEKTSRVGEKVCGCSSLEKFWKVFGCKLQMFEIINLSNNFSRSQTFVRENI